MKKLAIILLLLLLAGCATGTLSQAQLEQVLAGIVKDIQTLGSDIQVLDKRTRVLVPTAVPTPVAKILPTIVAPK